MSQRALRVLVVDDETVISDTLVQILDMHGMKAAAAYSGEDAVALARTFRPDAAVLDVILGGLTGIAAAHAILDEFPDCHIILFSGQIQTMALLAEASLNGKEFPVYTKPVHPRELVEALARGAGADAGGMASNQSIPRCGHD